MSKIILIRHAQSTFNAYGEQIRDVPLSDYGKTTCSSLNFNVDLVICSNMQRTKQTLEHSNIKYNDIIITPLCREHMNGNIIDYCKGEDIIVESVDELAERVKKFKKFVKDATNDLINKNNAKAKANTKNTGQTITSRTITICIISHSGFLRKLTGHFFNNAHYLECSSLDDFNC